jgi:hypothetical protein
VAFLWLVSQLLATPTAKQLGGALRCTPLCKRDQSFCSVLTLGSEAAIRNNVVTTRLGLDLLGICFSGPQAELLACFCEDVRPNGCNMAGYDSNLDKYLWLSRTIALIIYCIDGVFRHDIELELKPALRNKARTMNVTALPTCPLDFDNSTYSCANPYPNCTNAASFEFASLWIITQAIATCPTDTRLFNSQPMLTNHACLLFTHKKAWTLYPAADIWARLTTWKFPLLQLVAVFPRPPLTFGTECFVLLHLLGDPISTIANLLLKVASCQARAALWKYRLRPNGEEEQLINLWAGLPRTPSHDGLWKALTAIVDSYDEWGPDIGTKVQELIFDRL